MKFFNLVFCAEIDKKFHVLTMYPELKVYTYKVATAEEYVNLPNNMIYLEYASDMSNLERTLYQEGYQHKSTTKEFSKT